MKFYAAGLEITKAEKDKILCGETDKIIRCPDGQPGIPLCWFTDTFLLAEDGSLDPADPRLVEVLAAAGQPLDRTFIVSGVPSPLHLGTRTAIFGYW